MRLHLTLRPPNQCSIGFNYSYYLSAAIYSWIEKSSPTYSAFLHDQGFSLEGTARKFKHFCFSQLIIPHRKIDNGRIVILSDKISWYISMPIEESLQHLVVGMFEKQQFYIERTEQQFLVDQVEILPEPNWKRTMNFKMLSPLTISVAKENNGKLMPQYLRTNDPSLGDAIQKNMLNKFRSLYGKEPDEEDFHCMLDEHFINDRGGHEKISKLITIKQGQPGETKVRGFMCPITITGNPNLIKLAHESGLGEKGSLGFGMIEVK